MSDSIFIIDTDQGSVDNLQQQFELTSLSITHISDYQQALDKIRMDSPSLILMEAYLPGFDGLGLCKEIRQFSDVPILFISSRTEEIDRLLAYEFGADDYISKPFSSREVVAKVRAHLGRKDKVAPIEASSDSDDIRLNATRLQVSYLDKKTELTSVEFRILKLLTSKPGDIFTRPELIRSVYRDNRIVSERTIDSHIKKLRTKMSSLFADNEVIHSAYGTGYKYEL